MVLIFLAFSTLFISCKNDDDHSVAVNPSLFGIWELRETFYGSEPFPLNECQKQTTLTFSENGTLLRKNQITEEEPCSFSDVIQEFTFTENGFRAFYTLEGGQDGSYEVDFIILTENRLEFRSVWNSQNGSIPEDERVTHKYERI